MDTAPPARLKLVPQARLRLVLGPRAALSREGLAAAHAPQAPGWESPVKVAYGSSLSCNSEECASILLPQEEMHPSGRWP